MANSLSFDRGIRIFFFFQCNLLVIIKNKGASQYFYIFDIYGVIIKLLLEEKKYSFQVKGFFEVFNFFLHSTIT